MDISIFLSYPRPCFRRQEEFLVAMRAYIKQLDLAPRTLGVNEYDTNTPLTAIRRMMNESNGLLTIAFRRTLIKEGATRSGTDITGQEEGSLNGVWLTSPWAQIEAAMAFQLGLPILILREKGVHADGILEKGIVGLYMPEFDLDQPVSNYFDSPEWKQIITQWCHQARTVLMQKGQPPIRY
jgi:hypothetical protein